MVSSISISQLYLFVKKAKSGKFVFIINRSQSRFKVWTLLVFTAQVRFYFVGKVFKTTNGTLSVREGHLTENYTGPKNFINTISHSLA